jgi:hypothetical protein
MSILLTTLLPALLPAVGDGVRGLFAKFTGSAGADPQNVDEKIKLMQAETDKLKALAEIDKPTGKASLWVTNLRESARYIAVYVVIANGFLQSFFNPNPEVVVLSLELASSGFFFLFGDRVYVNLKGKKD